MAKILSIQAAADFILEGGVIAMPTEGVWGLSCNPNDDKALKKVIAIKKRPTSKGLIIVAASFEQLEGLVNWDKLTKSQLKLICSSWPGANTWIVPAKHSLSHLLMGEHNSIAVRVSSHPVIQELCRICKMPLVSTSANLHGQTAVTEQQSLSKEIINKIDGIIPGAVQQPGKVSIIRDAMTGEMLRAGG